MAAIATADYNGIKAERLNKKLRWSAAFSAVAAVATAGLLPWAKVAGNCGWCFAILAAMFSLVTPLLAGWAKAKGWRADFMAFVRGQDAARFMEVETIALYNKLDLRDYRSLDQEVRQFQVLMQRWEFVSQLPPPEKQDEELAKDCWNRAERILGLERDDHV